MLGNLLIISPGRAWQSPPEVLCPVLWGTTRIYVVGQELFAFCIFFDSHSCPHFLQYLLHLRFSLVSLILCWWCFHIQLLISFLGSPAIFRSWIILFLPSCLFVFSCNFSRELFISHLKCPISIKSSTFKSKTCFSSVLGCLGLAVVVLCLLGFCWQCFYLCLSPSTCLWC